MAVPPYDSLPQVVSRRGYAMPTEREIRQAMTDARNGGDYAALFRGKKLGFKFEEAAKSCKEIKESIEDVTKATKEGSVPPDSVTTAARTLAAY